MKEPNQRRRFPVFRATFVALLLIAVGLLFTPIPKKIYRGLDRLIEKSKSTSGSNSEGGAPEPEVVIKEVEKEVVKIVEVRDPLPAKFVNYKSIDTAKLWSGIDVNSEMAVKEGGPASEEREKADAYTFEFKINLTVPKPNATPGEIAGVNPELPKVLPALAAMLESGKVSGFYHKLYEIKAKRVQQLITRLNAVPSRHNFYDCETVMELSHPETGRKVFFLQGDMDVVSDGSDGDRMPEYDEYIASSSNYRPFTSYGWKKRTGQPNPLLERWKTRLAEAEKLLADGKVSRSRTTAHKEMIATLKREIADMKARSFLIARADPFIVVPVWMQHYANQNDYSPKVGDYAAVVHGGRIFPAIVGDTGPQWKVGEASLRLAKEINPKSSPYSRPESDLHVSYLIFPGTRDEVKSPPDLEKWHKRVGGLLGEIGGLGEGYKLHAWDDYFAEDDGGGQGESETPGG